MSKERWYLKAIAKDGSQSICSPLLDLGQAKGLLSWQGTLQPRLHY